MTDKRIKKHAYIKTCLGYGVVVGRGVVGLLGRIELEGKRVDTATPYGTDAYYF